MSNLSHPVFSRIYDKVMVPVEKIFLRKHRTYLTQGISGYVLDLGSGTGLMFPYFKNIKNGVDVSFFAIEPDPNMRVQAEKRAKEIGLDIEISSADAEMLPFKDNSFEVVICSLVFCTIPKIHKAFSEISRILKPSGELRFLEHIRGKGIAGFILDSFAPFWYYIAGGCHLNRKTDEILLKKNEFSVTDFQRINSNIPMILPFIKGKLKLQS